MFIMLIFLQANLLISIKYIDNIITPKYNLTVQHREVVVVVALLINVRWSVGEACTPVISHGVEV